MEVITIVIFQSSDFNEKEVPMMLATLPINFMATKFFTLLSKYFVVIIIEIIIKFMEEFQYSFEINLKQVVIITKKLTATVTVVATTISVTTTTVVIITSIVAITATIIITFTIIVEV